MSDREALCVAALVQYRDEMLTASELAEFESIDWLNWKWSVPSTITGWFRDLTLDYGM